MIVQPSGSFQVIWIGWVVSWVAASLWSGRTEKRAVTRETWIYRIIIFAGAILIAPWTAQERPSWQVGYYGACALVSVILMGLALTWWARIHLGCLWSSAITRKEKHRLIESGPYAFVRHPIYTGLIIALLATAAIEATLVALLGALLIVLGHQPEAQHPKSSAIHRPPADYPIFRGVKRTSTSEQLIEATKRATSFRGFSFANLSASDAGQRIGAIASEPDRGVRDSHVLDVGITLGLRKPVYSSKCKATV